ncbi:MAG: CoA pyrophosphatase [Candidatus Kapabacteria bacterium]|nr:CoA pyrophosphatase [Candidatus Kapabacteria bacterium]
MTRLDIIRTALAGPLPGVRAHAHFVPSDMPDAAKRLQKAPDDARRSAVLVPLLLRDDDDVDVLLTVRTTTLRSHGGQISFPGGRIDQGEDVTTTALRELDEETGIPAHDVAILGNLSPIWVPPSNSAITPIVGLVRTPAQYVPSEAEVEEIFTVPLSVLLDDASVHVAPWTLYDRTVQVRHWRVHPRVPLWGATAMILNELLEVIRAAEHAAAGHATINDESAMP